MEKILVCGDRRWDDYTSILGVLILFKEKYGPDLIIVQGKAKGADSLAEKAANALKLETRGYPARWDLYGKGAGPVRNKYQFDQEQPDLTLAFHDSIEYSKGTLNMVNYSTLQDCPTLIMFHGEEAVMDYKWWSMPYDELLPF